MTDSMKIRFANCDSPRRFSVQQYLVERFPELPQSALLCDKLAELDELALPPFDMAETDTIYDALGRLDKELQATLRSKLPNDVVRVLTDWLVSCCKRYSVPESYDWDAFFWQYVSLLGDHGITFGINATGVVPPLVDCLEVNPLDHSFHLNRANLCDTLLYSFSHPVPALDPHGNYRIDPHGRRVDRWERMDRAWQEPKFDDKDDDLCDYFDVEKVPLRSKDGRIQMDDYDGQNLWLVINWQGRSAFAAWLEKMAGFPHYPAASQPRDHWVFRKFEVERMLATNVLSRTMPSWIERALAHFPRVEWEIQEAASACSRANHSLLDPVWLNRNTMLKSVETARQKIKDEDLGPLAFPSRQGEKRHKEGIDQLGRWATAQRLQHARSFMQDNAALKTLQAKLPNVPKRALLSMLASQTPPSNDTVSLPSDDAENGLLLPAELAIVSKQLTFSRQQELFDAHWRTTGALERFLRTVFMDCNPHLTSCWKIDDAFCEWVSRQDNQQVTKKVRRKDVPTHALDELLTAHLDAVWWKTNENDIAEKLADRLDRVSEACIEGLMDNLGTPLRDLLKFDGNVGSAAWWDVLSDFLRPSNRGFLKALFAGKLLFAIRNFLAHSRFENDQPDRPDEVNVSNDDRSLTLRLNAKSLDHCFRLLVATTSFLVLCAKLADEWEFELFRTIVTGNSPAEVRRQ